LVKTDRRNGGDDRAGAPEPTPSAVWRGLLDQDHEGSRREAAIARIAGHLLRRFVDPHATLGICHIFNERRCREPLARTEVRRIVNDIASREADRRESRR
jgi:Primase C terminal 1 (PriCT-1)